MGSSSRSRKLSSLHAMLGCAAGVMIAIPLVASVVPAGCGADPNGPPLVGSDYDAGTMNDDGGCVMAPPPPPLDPSTLPSCCTMAAAHCIPAADVVASIQKQLATCDGGYCEPDPIIKNPAFVPATCTAFNGMPGACVSLCVPQVQQYLNVLKQGTCGSDERCAPCINPLDNTNTGACDVGKPCGSTDDGGTDGGVVCPYTGPPKVDPTSFPACSPACGGAHCVPAAIVPPSQQSQLVTCPSAGPGSGGPLDGFCVPDPFIASGGQSLPAVCKSVAGSEGRCLSTCIPQVAGQEIALPQSTCASNERCAPCYNPSAPDPTAPTGACSIACDKPADPPTILPCPYTGPPIVDTSTFPECAPACGGAHCVPVALVPASQQSQLAACPGGFCVPDPIASTGNHYVPPTCTAFGDPASEGRCLSNCLVPVQQQSSQLIADVCTTGNLCVPCTDPFSGMTTGACTQACDKPADPPFTFPTCCSFNGQPQGTCIPKRLLSASQQSNLKQDVCPGNAANYFCVPDEYLPNSTTPVQNCTTVLGNGTCVSKCANIPAGGITFTQGTCTSNHVCVPCSLAPAGTPGC